MKAHSTILLTLTLAVASAAGAACIGSGQQVRKSDSAGDVDTVANPVVEVMPDSVTDSIQPVAVSDNSADWETRMKQMGEIDAATRYTTLSDEDFKIVADELGVEVAAIKAVVRIEAGTSLQGFLAPGVPVVNFDRSMYNKARPTSNIKAPASEKVPAGITNAHGKKEWTQLVAARKQNLEKANMGTFWGMFQIGGFNYKLCGCKTVQEFVDRMSYSEFEQLQLFANFITNTGMLKDLQNKNWAGFARKYNGASYKSRGYHTKMANAYAKYKAEEK